MSLRHKEAGSCGSVVSRRVSCRILVLVLPPSSAVPLSFVVSSSRAFRVVRMIMHASIAVCSIFMSLFPCAFHVAWVGWHLVSSMCRLHTCLRIHLVVVGLNTDSACVSVCRDTYAMSAMWYSSYEANGPVTRLALGQAPCCVVCHLGSSGAAALGVDTSKSAAE